MEIIVYIFLLLHGMFCVCLLGSHGLKVKSNVSLLIFCLGDLFIVESGVVDSPTIIVLVSITPFRSVSICIMYLGV